MASIKNQARIMSRLIAYHNLKNVITIGFSYGDPLAATLTVKNLNVKASGYYFLSNRPEARKRCVGISINLVAAYTMDSANRL